jgi:hypothetical protein
MLQFVSQLIPVLMAGFIAYLLFKLGAALKYSGTYLSDELGWMLPRTPALDAFLMFVIGAAIVVTAAACALMQVSNHIILSLDILFFLSMLLLILFHTFKEFGNLHAIEE